MSVPLDRCFPSLFPDLPIRQRRQFANFPLPCFPSRQRLLSYQWTVKVFSEIVFHASAYPTSSSRSAHHPISLLTCYEVPATSLLRQFWQSRHSSTRKTTPLFRDFFESCRPNSLQVMMRKQSDCERWEEGFGSGPRGMIDLGAHSTTNFTIPKI